MQTPCLRSLLVVSGLLVLGFLVGCASAQRPVIEVVPSPAVTPHPSPTPIIAAECGWFQTLHAYTDSNENRQFDVGEPPLAGVVFTIESSVAATYDTEPTNAEGKHEELLMLWGCPPASIHVRVRIPDGYRATTPTEIDGSSLPDDSTISFGLVPTP